jgi:hypothetical protein
MYNVQAFESFVLRCPKEITPHLESIVTTALRFVKHDPNYADDDDDDQMEEDEQDEEDEYSDDGDYSGFVLTPTVPSQASADTPMLLCVCVLEL